MKKKCMMLIILGISIFYFYPSDIRIILNNQIELDSINEIKILTIFPGLAPNNTKSIDSDEEREQFWDELESIKVVKMPLLKYTTGVSEKKLFNMMIFDKDRNMSKITIDDSVLTIEDKSYWILNRKNLNENIFIE